MRNIQHKKEAYWFYRFLSIFYDKYVNPFFWTESMRDRALALGRFDTADLKIVDVGSGTGFTTQGIVQQAHAAEITCLDQSPHQMAKAQRKAELQECSFRLGDAEDLPFPTDHFDRYVSAGSIEYWPEPERGIAEAYRVVKPGGVALMIGPLRPQQPIARWAADTWMLFPEEEAYESWFHDAGFTDIQKVYVAPSWVQQEKYGIAIAGTKPAAGPSSMKLNPVKTEDVQEPMSPARALSFGLRLLVGTLAGFLFIPIALYGYLSQLVQGWQRDQGIDLDPLTPQQRRSILGLLVGVTLLLLLRRRKLR